MFEDCSCVTPDEGVARISGFTGAGCDYWNGDYVLTGGDGGPYSYVDAGPPILHILCIGGCAEGDLPNTGWGCGVGEGFPECSAQFNLFGTFAEYCIGGPGDYSPAQSDYSLCSDPCDPGSPTFELDL